MANNNSKVRWKRECRGSVLSVTLVVTVLVILLSSGFLMMLVNESGQVRRYALLSKALHVAEAGIEAAVWEIKYGGADFSGWSGSNPYSRSETLISELGSATGEFRVFVHDLGNDRFRVESAGFIPDQANPTVSREVQVEVVDLKIPPYAVFAENEIVIASNSIIDSYKSEDGFYGGSNKYSNGDIATNGTSTSPPAIAITGNATIQGDGYVGVGGDVANAIDTDLPNAEIEGSEESLVSSVYLVDIEPIGGLPYRGDMKTIAGSTLVISEDGEYGDFIVPNGKTVEINEDVILHVNGTFGLQSNTEFRIVNGAEVIVYVDGAIVSESNSTWNNVSQDPKTFYVIGTEALVDSGGTPGVDIRSNSDFYGVVYAPYATVNINSNSDFYGSVVGEHVMVDANNDIHFDESLITSASGPFGFQVARGSWVEK